MTDWTERVYYGGDLPREAERALHEAAVAWEDPPRAEACLAHALALAPDHRAVYLGLYKYHFYRGDLVRAAPLALWLARHALRALNLPEDWRTLRPDEAPFLTLDTTQAAEPRFFLFALKAYGYLNVRLGDTAEGLSALRKVADLDPSDATGTASLIAVVERGPPGEDDEDQDAA